MFLAYAKFFRTRKRGFPVPVARRARAAGLAVALAVGGPAAAAAQDAEPLITDRPDFTESAATVAPGRLQFELGYTFTRAGDREQHDVGEALVRLGILPGLEGRLGLNSLSLLRDPGAEDREGLEDLTVAFKIRLHRPDALAPRAAPRLSLLAGADLPTGASGFGSDRVQPGAKLIAAWDLSDRFALAGNAGWAYLRSDEEDFHQGVGSLVLGNSISSSVTAYVEWFGLFPESRGGGASHFLDGGFAWLLSPDLQLDWRIGVGLEDPDPWFSGVGLSFRL